MDAYNFLLYSSNHPKSCKDSIPFAQILRLLWLCSDNADLIKKSLAMLDFFRRRLYTAHILDNDF